MLDITADVLDGGEQGLLGLAIDPDYPTRPHVYLYYNNTTPNLQYVVRYTVTGTLNNSSSTDLNLDAASRVYLLNDIPNNASNHNGGTLRFGTDKMLYISMGDDANSCDAQNRTLLKGAIFRIKVDNTIVINSNVADKASLVPAGNPWAAAVNVNERLVFAYGLRNPFRFNVHPDTGALFIGDVGSGTREEVDISTGGENFGWPYWEGNVTGPNTGCGGGSGTMPIYDYTRGTNPSASVIGGVVYKGVSFPNDASLPSEFNGNFFFNDYYTGNLRVLRWNGSSWNLVSGVDSSNFGTGYSYVSDWTVGPDGAIYYVNQGGSRIVRIAYTGGGVTIPSLNSGASSGGSGCGFVKDDGKGQGAKGEGLALMMMLIIALVGTALLKKGCGYEKRK
jgi:glucose/arabinose dehydrogenase